jgi:DNA helicase HerA-like ATPase
VQELNKVVRQKNDKGKDKDIGKTLASDRFPNTMDSFWFSINPDIIISPFDFVTVRHIFNTRTIGMVKELTAAEDIGTTARVAVMANTGIESGSVKTISIGMPVGEAKPVRFATQKEVIFALGIPEMQNPIPAGLIEMTNGLQVPVSLDISYLLGPDTAHVNAAGISGNLKTSYLFFLLQSAYQRLVKDMQEDVAIIIFNTKEEDLLHIDKKKKASKKTKILFDLLDLDIKPFENVTYFLPRGRDGRPNSAVVPSNSKTYSFGLEDVYDKLDLLFGINDDTYNVSSILNYIYEAWPLLSGSKQVSTWSDLLEFRGYPQEVVAHKSTLLRFLGHVQRFRKSPMFIDKKVTSRYLGKEIKKIRRSDVFVIDISMIPTLQEQGFVVGDVMKSIDELYSSRQSGKRPKYILIFVDEINRFIPRSVPNMSAVAEHVMRTIVAGRSRGTILFSAQQFKSTVDPALHENTGMHIIAKLGMSELSAPPYLMIDESTKANIVRLNKGELVMVHPAFRQPIKIVFPKAPFKTG